VISYNVELVSRSSQTESCWSQFSSLLPAINMLQEEYYCYYFVWEESTIVSTLNLNKRCILFKDLLLHTSSKLYSNIWY